MRGNQYLYGLTEAGVKKVILRMVANKELYTPEQVDELLRHNNEMTSKLLTIAINRAFGIGKKRFEEKGIPALVGLEAEYDKWVAEVDTEYADGLLDRLYDSIME